MDIAAEISSRHDMIRNYPSQSALSGILNFIPYYTNYLQFLRKLSEKHGDIVPFRAKGEKIWLVNDLDTIEHILIKNPDNYLRGTGFSKLRMLLGEGLLSSDGAHHKRHRTMAQPSFHKRSVEGYSNLIEDCVKEKIGEWKHGSVINIQDESVDLFLKVIIRLLFGNDNNGELLSMGKYFDSLTYNYKAIMLVGFNHITRKLPFKWVDEFYVLKEKYDETIYELIKERRINPKEDNSILSLLMDARDSDGKGFTDEELRDELTTLYFAAYDTSARTLTWSVYLLTKNPDIKKKLTSFEEESAIEYTNMIISEALRIYPPAHSITRVTKDDDSTDKVKFRSGDSVIICPYHIHRDNRYFDRPLEFIPERWSKENKKDIKRFSYLPFGAGIRSCMGEYFARMQVASALLQLCKEYDFNMINKTNVKESPSLTLKPSKRFKIKLTSVAK